MPTGGLSASVGMLGSMKPAGRTPAPWAGDQTIRWDYHRWPFTANRAASWRLVLPWSGIGVGRLELLHRRPEDVLPPRPCGRPQDSRPARGCRARRRTWARPQLSFKVHSPRISPSSFGPRSGPEAELWAADLRKLT